jgi:hypothetical protein
MNVCRGCGNKNREHLLYLGTAPLSNRFIAPSYKGKTRQYYSSFTLVKCANCSLLQLQNEVPDNEIIPVVDWIVYKEPEFHLKALFDKLVDLGICNASFSCLGLTYKDQPLVNMFEKHVKFAHVLDPEIDLKLTKKGIAGETVLPKFIGKTFHSHILKKYGSQDIIIARHCLEHVCNTHVFIDSLIDLLSSDGTIIFEVPDCSNQIKSCDYTFPWEEHLSYFTESTLAECINSSRLHLIELDRFPNDNEDILVATCKLTHSNKITPPKPEYNLQKDLYNSWLGRYVSNFPEKKRKIRAKLKDFADESQVAIYGAGHFSIAFINFFEIEGYVHKIFDDNPDKLRHFLPGSSRLIIEQPKLDPSIKVCLVGIPDKYMPQLQKKYVDWQNSGGKFLSIFPDTNGNLGIGDSIYDHI